MYEPTGQLGDIVIITVERADCFLAEAPRLRKRLRKELHINPARHSSGNKCVSFETRLHVIRIFGNLFTRVWKIRDRIFETESKFGVQIWFQILLRTRQNKSNKKKIVSWDLGPKSWVIIILGGEFGLFRRAYPTSETTLAHQLSILFHK